LIALIINTHPARQRALFRACIPELSLVNTEHGPARALI